MDHNIECDTQELFEIEQMDESSDWQYFYTTVEMEQYYIEWEQNHE